MIAKSVTLTSLFCLSFLVGGAAGAVAPPTRINASTLAGNAIPASLRQALYQTLARDTGSVYGIGKKDCATLSKQRLKGCLTATGARFGGTDARTLTLRLAAWGRGEALRTLPPVDPVVAGDRVSYAHEALTEWWQVLPMGFEQGFTVAKRPAGNGALTFVLNSSGKPVAKDGTVAIGKLRYGDLVVTDADGKVVPAVLKTKNNRIRITVNDTNAAYPLTVDPLVWIEQKVMAPSSASQTSDGFGGSVVIRGDTALIGAPATTRNNHWQEGAVYVLTYAYGSWSQTDELTASDETGGSLFGSSVALYGPIAVIGAVTENTYVGAAYVFVKSGGTWNQVQKLTASGSDSTEYFGADVSIDGATILVGAPRTTVNGTLHQGAVYVFSYANGTWTQTAELTADDGAQDDNFGMSLQLANGTALIGAPDAMINGNTAQGAAYVFTDAGGTWVQTQKLTASDGAAPDQFGYSVALANNIALVGSPYATVGGNDFQGAGYVFTESGGTWSQAQKLTASDGDVSDRFGSAVALSDTTALVGAPYQCLDIGCSEGAAYIFIPSGGLWTQAVKLTVPDGGTEQLGNTVALSNVDALLSAPSAFQDGHPINVAYFFVNSDLNLMVTAPQTISLDGSYTSETHATNDSTADSPAVAVTVAIPAAATFISATSTQGDCSEISRTVTCLLGQLPGNGGNANIDVSLKAIGNLGDTIENTASVSTAIPPLTTSAPTTITGCPESYTEYDGTLNAGGLYGSPTYQAPAGLENGILGGPAGFQLYAQYSSGGSPHLYRIPGNEIHKQAPAGTYRWGVKAGSTGGDYVLCILHP